MSNNEILSLSHKPSLRTINGGLFISRGEGIHPERVMDTYELIFVRRGCLGMFEESRDFRVNAGESLLLWPGRRHGGTLPYAKDLSFYWLHFERGSKGKGSESIEVPQHSKVVRPDRLEEMLRRFLDDQEAQTLQHPAADLLLMLMLCEVARPAAVPADMSSSVVALAQRAKDFIELNYAKPISASDVAKALRCNADYLGRIFRQVFSLPLTRAIHRSRLNASKSLLMNTNMTIAEIAADCGFEDPGYFRRIFRREEGLSPRDFRRIHARVYINTR